MADVPMDFEQWMEISAGLRGRDEAARQQLIQRLGLASAWAGEDARWAAALLDDVAEGNLERVMQYGDACAQERARRGRGEDALAERAARAPAPTSPVASHEPGPAPVAAAPVAAAPAAAPPAPAPAPAPAPVAVVPMAAQVAPAPATAASAGAAPPSAVPASGDFRQNMHAPVSGQPAPAAGIPGGVDFVRHMAGEAHGAPVKPSAGQVQTASVSAHADLAALQKALVWGVDTYAAFCLAHHTRPVEEVAAQFDVVASAFAGIHKAWRKRLTDDPALHTAYNAHYTRLQRGHG